MTRVEAGDWIAVAAPLLGATINFLCQVALARLRPEEPLHRIVVVAFSLGVLVTLTGIVFVSLLGSPELLEGIGLASSALIAYGSAGFVLFALVNLGKTSLRVQMISRLLESPDGLSPAELLALQPETTLIEVRVRRMKENRQVRVVHGRLYPRLSMLLVTTAGIALLKLLLYGRRKGTPHASGVL